MTSYKAVGVHTNTIQLERGADYYRSRVKEVNAATGVVTCDLEMPLGKIAGLDGNWVASNEDQTHFWRADYLGDNRFKLRGAPVSKAAFGDAEVLRLWEMGAGDVVRQSTFVSLRRVGAGVYCLEGNAGATVSLPYRKLLVSTDGKTWQAPQAAKTEAGWTTMRLPAGVVSASLRIKVMP